MNDPATTSDDFGTAVAKSGVGPGATVIVGAAGYGNNSAGVAYLYVRGSHGWPTRPTTTLMDPAATSGDDFGDSVAVSGRTAVVGAPGLDNNSAGLVYIYVKGSSGWPTTPTVTLTDPVGGFPGPTGFGVSVAVSGDTTIVGQYGPSGTSAAYF